MRIGDIKLLKELGIGLEKIFDSQNVLVTTAYRDLRDVSYINIVFEENDEVYITCIKMIITREGIIASINYTSRRINDTEIENIAWMSRNTEHKGMANKFDKQMTNLIGMTVDI